MYEYYDNLRVNSSNLTFIPFIEDEAVEGQAAGLHVGRNLHLLEDTGEILCHVPTILRWTEDGEDVSDDSYGGAVAALLAMYHFNTGNASIVDELENIHLDCPIRFTTELIDSQSSASVATEALTRIITRIPQDIEYPQPCALLGCSRSSITKVLATVTGVYDLVQVTPSASSVELDDQAEYPLFARTHPSDASMAQLSIDFLATQLNVEFVAVLYVDNTFGNSYNEELLKQASLYNMTIVSAGFRDGATDEEVSAALEKLQRSGHRYFLGVFFPADYERVMLRAVELDIAGEDTFWMFNGAMASSFINGQLEIPSDSPLANATYGTAILSDEGGLPGLDEHHDRFLKMWQDIGSDEALLTYINSKLPRTGSLSFERTKDYFENVSPSHIAAFSYDAVAGLGLSACKVYKESEPETSPDIFTGQQHHEAFIENTFRGASGSVIIGPDSFSRRANSTYHVVSNILPNETGSRFYEGRPWIVYETSTNSWQRYDTVNDFVYSSGTTVPPRQIPPLTTDNSEVSPAVRGICLSMGAIGMMLSVAFYIYCCIMKRDHRVIRAAQPFFLGLICFGSLVLSSSIIPAALDDIVVSEKGADIACVMRSWLFPLGFCLIFSALFSKLWRINKLLSKAATFQRVQVKPKDVIIPFIVLVGSNIVILTVWTILDPPHWEREVVKEDAYGRPIETRGYCHSDQEVAFLAPLVAINGIALVMALWQAWVCRGITTDLSESKYIAMATACIFQALFMGVPIIVIANDDATALLFVYTTIVSVISFSILLLIFVPKIMALRRNGVGVNGAQDPSVRIGGKTINVGRSASIAGKTAARVTMAGQAISISGQSDFGQWAEPSERYEQSTTSDSGVEPVQPASLAEVDESDVPPAVAS